MKGGFNYITSPSTQTWSEPIKGKDMPPLKHFVGFVEWWKAKTMVTQQKNLWRKSVLLVKTAE